MEKIFCQGGGDKTRNFNQITILTAKTHTHDKRTKQKMTILQQNYGSFDYLCFNLKYIELIYKNSISTNFTFISCKIPSVAYLLSSNIKVYLLDYDRLTYVT